MDFKFRKSNHKPGGIVFPEIKENDEYLMKKEIVVKHKLQKVNHNTSSILINQSYEEELLTARSNAIERRHRNKRYR